MDGLGRFSGVVGGWFDWRMRMRTMFLEVWIIGLLVVGCSGEDGESTPTAAVAGPTATATTALSEVTATGTPIEAPADTPVLAPTATATAEASAGADEGVIGPQLMWDPAPLFPRLQEACPGTIEPSCLVEPAREEGAPERVIEFFQTYEVFLYDFQEMGVVDYGAVNSPLLNMGRPIPVFLNGDFGVLYINEVIPEDWKAQPTYTDPAIADFLWTEYSQLIDSTASASGQAFDVAVPIGGCRACQRDGHLNLVVRFDNVGALDAVEVKPFSAEP